MTLPQPLNRRKVTALFGASLGGALLTPRLALAQDIDMAKVMLGVPAGSMVDSIARRIAEALKYGYSTSSLVENKTGAGGILAVSAVKTAPADGRTLLVAASSPITLYPSTYKQLPYDPRKDLIPVTTIATFDLALAVGPMVPKEVTNLKDFYAWCKANPGQASFGSPASGSTPHFVGSMTARLADVPVQHVGYRGPGPAAIDMIGGQIASIVVPLVDVLEAHKAGKCRILAVTGTKRGRFVPNVPTFEEQGLGEYAIPAWIGVYLPTGTPATVVNRLSNTLKAALADPRFVGALEQTVQDVFWSSQDDLRRRIEQEQVKWAAAVKELKFTPES